MLTDKMPVIQAGAASFSIKGGILRIRFLVKDPEIRLREIRLHQRYKENVFNLFKIKKSRRKEGILYSCELDLNTAVIECGYCDITAIVLKKGEKALEARLGGQSRILKYAFIAFPRWARVEPSLVIYPFVNKDGCFTIQIRNYLPDYDSWKFIFKEYLALACYYLLKPYWDRKKLWLIGEKYCSVAQDNGFAFFKYCMENLPESEKKHIFFVIDPKTETYQKLLGQYRKNLMPFMTFRYLILLQAAELLISSDGIRHFYIWDSPNTLSRKLLKIRKKIVFLQHGVMAFKQTHEIFGKNSRNPVNLFVVSSPFEKEIIRDYFGYDEKEIIMTGLSRWDQLTDRSSDAHKEILIMPTWRSWMEDYSDEEFLDTDYFRNYRQLLTDPAFFRFLEEKDLYVNFYIHPKFKDYIHLFAAENPRVQIIVFGSKPVNELLASCKMIITDYSSVSWDIYFQGKPVLFYVFDKEKYDRMQGGYMDMEKDGFGDLVYDTKELLEALGYYADNGFQEKEIYAARRERLLPFRDQKNSERIYQEILRYLKRSPRS